MDELNLAPAAPCSVALSPEQQAEIAALRAEILAEADKNEALALSELPTPREFDDVPLSTNAKGQPIPPPPQRVADSLIGGFGSDFLRDGEDPFFWQKNHWQERNPKNFKRYLMNTAQFLRSGDATHSELSGISELFMNRAPALRDKQTFYQQNPFLANFLDGTLEVIKEPGGKYRKEFREHRKEDLLTWTLPYKYNAPRLRNRLFEEWLSKAFSEDEDGAGKIRALKQLGGACLISLFPRVAMLIGPGGTGKSTFAKLCMKFVGERNYSSLPPHLIEGFHMETMIGKQINVVTDIGKAPIPEAFMKLVEDSLPLFVNRKGRQAIFAKLPSLHIFCANALPRGIDGESNAMDRRISIVEFTKSMLGEGGEGYTRDYEEVLLNAGPGAILDFFEDGLDDLIQCGGLYFNPDSGKSRLQDWKDSESLTAQILNALKYRELGEMNSPLIIDKSSRILRSKIGLAISLWAGKTLPSQQLNRIYQELGARGFPMKISGGRIFLEGIRESGIADNLGQF